MRGRGSGSATAVTMTSWFALATIPLSVPAVSPSSALRRSRVVRSSMRTMRARVPLRPLVSPTTATRSPTTTLPRPSSRAFMAVMLPLESSVRRGSSRRIR